ILARFVGDASADLGDERRARRFNRDAREHGTRRVAHGSGEALRPRQTGSRAEDSNYDQQSNQHSIHERPSTTWDHEGSGVRRRCGTMDRSAQSVKKAYVFERLFITKARESTETTIILLREICSCPSCEFRAFVINKRSK